MSRCRRRPRKGGDPVQEEREPTVEPGSAGAHERLTSFTALGALIASEEGGGMIHHRPGGGRRRTNGSSSLPD